MIVKEPSALGLETSMWFSALAHVSSRDLHRRHTVCDSVWPQHHVQPASVTGSWSLQFQQLSTGSCVDVQVADTGNQRVVSSSCS